MSGYGELERLTATPLDRAVDAAIADCNERFLADPQAQQEAADRGRLYARVFEAQELGFVQLPYPQETLEQFCQRAGV